MLEPPGGVHILGRDAVEGDEYGEVIPGGLVPETWGISESEIWVTSRRETELWVRSETAKQVAPMRRGEREKSWGRGLPGDVAAGGQVVVELLQALGGGQVLECDTHDGRR